jgi:hypothetical protein
MQRREESSPLIFIAFIGTNGAERHEWHVFRAHIVR